MGSARQKIALSEAAERLGVHYMTAYKYVRTGRLPAEKVGAEWRVDPADLARVRPGREPAPTGGGSRRAASADRLHQRLVAGDEPGAWAIVEDALTSGAGPVDVHFDLLIPALRTIGDRWEAGELTVADEHRGAAVAQRIIGRLGPRFAVRGRKRGTVVVGAPSDELHGVPVSIAADLLRRARFDVVDLGPNTPARSFVDAVTGAGRVVAVGLCITTPYGEAGLVAAAAALRRAQPELPLFVGGAGVRDGEYAAELGASGFTAFDARELVRRVEEAAPA